MQTLAFHTLVKTTIYLCVLMSCTLCNSLHTLPAHMAKEQCPHGLATYDDVINKEANISVHHDGRSGWIAGYAQLSKKTITFDACYNSIRSRKSFRIMAEFNIVSQCAYLCQNHSNFGVQSYTCHCLCSDERNNLKPDKLISNSECFQYCGGVMSSNCNQYVRVYRFTSELHIAGHGQCVYASRSSRYSLQYESTSCHMNNDNTRLPDGYICQNARSCPNGQLHKHPQICIQPSEQLSWTAAFKRCTQNGKYGSLFSISSQWEPIHDNGQYWIGDFRAIVPTQDVKNSCLAITKVGYEIFLDSDDCNNSKIPICKLDRITSTKTNMSTQKNIFLDTTTNSTKINSLDQAITSLDTTTNSIKINMSDQTTISLDTTTEISYINTTISKPPGTDSFNKDSIKIIILIGVCVGLVIFASVILLIFVVRRRLKRSAAPNDRSPDINNSDISSSGSAWDMTTNAMYSLSKHVTKTDNKDSNKGNTKQNDTSLPIGTRSLTKPGLDKHASQRNSNQSYQSIELSAFSQTDADVRAKTWKTKEEDEEYDHINLTKPNKKHAKCTKIQPELDIHIYNHVTRQESDYNVTITTTQMYDRSDNYSVTETTNHNHDCQNPYDSVSTNKTCNNYKSGENIYGRRLVQQKSDDKPTLINTHPEGLDVLDNDSDTDIEEDNHYHSIHQLS